MYDIQDWRLRFTTCDGRLQGPGGNPRVFLCPNFEQDQALECAYRLSRDFVNSHTQCQPVRVHQVLGIILSLIFAVSARAETGSSSAATDIQLPWSHYNPYVPESKEYQFELGAMWEEENMYWLGLTYGHHLGRCIYSESTKCQQFLDTHIGWGSRESYTNSMAALSLRWQYVYFPEPYSPSFRLLLGGQKLRDDNRDHFHMVYGLGAGFTASLHKNFDMKIEGRVGGGAEPWTQVMLSFNLKIDHWVQDFRNKVQKLGEDTWDVSGKIIKGTVEAPGSVIDWLKETESKREDQSSTKSEMLDQTIQHFRKRMRLLVIYVQRNGQSYLYDQRFLYGCHQ